MKFYVIGNGFDFHYGLKTSYWHFKEYLCDNGFYDLVRKIDSVFDQFDIPKHFDIENWSDFENMLQVFNWLDPEDLYDEAMANAEDDDERAAYWDSPAWNVDYYNEYIKILKQQFNIWIEKLDTTIDKDEYFQPNAGDFILSFNYTTTIEDNFPRIKYDILHIHGTKNQEIVLGHNNYEKPYLMMIIEDEDSDYRDVSTKKAINDVLEEASVLYFKDSDNILKKYNNVFNAISEYNEVVFLGLSCGKADEVYVKKIASEANKITVYYYSYDDKLRFEKCINGRVATRYIGWK